MWFRLIAILALLLAGQDLVGRAQAQGWTTLQTKLPETVCHYSLEAFGPNDRWRQMLAAALAWDPGIVAKLQADVAQAGNIEPDEALKLLLKGKRFSAGVEQIVSKRLEAVEPLITADAARYPAAVCAVLNVQQSQDLEKFYDLFTLKQGRMQPYFALLQATLATAGCEIGEIDGIIGPQTLATWDKLGTQVRIDNLKAGKPEAFLKLLSEGRLLRPTCGADALGSGSAGLNLMAFTRFYAAGETQDRSCSADYADALDGYAKALRVLNAGDPLRAGLERTASRAVRAMGCLSDRYDSGASHPTAFADAFFETGIHREALFAGPNTLKTEVATGMLRKDGFDPKRVPWAIALLESVVNAQPDQAAPGEGAVDEESQQEDVTQKAASLLAHLYEAGLGVPKSSAKAAVWISKARTSASDRPDTASRTSDPRSYVLWALGNAGISKTANAAVPGDEAESSPDASESVSKDSEDQQHDADSPLTETLLRISTTSAERMPVLAELAELYATNKDARVAIIENASAEGLFYIATVLLEGLSRQGKKPQLALDLLQSPAAQDLAAAQTRLGMLNELGTASPKDVKKAKVLYEKAAAQGEKVAMLALARLHDDGLAGVPDLVLADKYYRMALAAQLKPRKKDEDSRDSEEDDNSPWRKWPLLIEEGLWPQLSKGSNYFNSSSGSKLLEDLVAADPSVVIAFARLYVCLDCGGAIKPVAAAQWYRRGVSGGSARAAYALAQLIIQFPGLATSKDEVKDLLQTAGKGSSPIASEAGLLLDTLSGTVRSEDDVRTLLDAACKDEDGKSTRTDCVRLAHRLAIGAISPQLVKSGYDFLASWAGRDIVDPDSRDLVKHASDALFDVLALYGNFKQAREVLQKNATDFTYYTPDRTYAARDQTFSRLIWSLADAQGESTADFDALLGELQARKDDNAAAFRQALDVIRAKKGDAALGLDSKKAHEVFAARLESGGASLSLASAARTLARTLEREGKKDEALTYELVGLNASIEVTRAEAVEQGPLPAKLIIACQLGRASERVSQLGFDDVATVLAKESVNTLQQVRRAIVGLPQNLQTCFRDIAADQYRYLADLFKRQGRGPDAVAVLEMLKDFETFRYVGLDTDYVQKAFDRLPMSQLEQDVLALALAIKPAVIEKTERFAELRRLRKVLKNKMAATDISELAALEAEVVAQDEAFLKRTAGLRTAIAGLSDPVRRQAEEQRALGELQQLKVILNPPPGGKPAAAIHYVILPDRMIGFLTTPSGQTSYTWTEMAGEAFSEAKLNERVAEFREAVTNKQQSAKAAAKELYTILFQQPAFDKELEKAHIKTLLLSADGRLRYIPFAALKGPKGYLVENFDLALLTSASRPAPAQPGATPVASAFATSKAIGGFDPLPYAEEEVDAIVGNGGTDAASRLLAGEVKRNDAFTLAAFQDAFITDADAPQRTFVHVASHFKLGRTPADSFLLLGNGGKLDVGTIQRSPTVYNFSHVDLLTLSACATAFADTDGTGQDLESFAAVAHKNGAATVVATQWSVADRSTSAFMRRFYELLVKDGATRAEALARVQREFISSGDPGKSLPFHWAPFVLMGVW